MSSNDIQQLIDQVAAGGVLKLTPARKEFQGPAVIRRPLTIEGQSCTLWAESGPVLKIESDGVVLKSLNVEVTGSDDQAGGASCALHVDPGRGVTLDDVAVRGNVIGLEAEEGEWRYPRSLRLGRLQPGHPHNFTAKLVAPAACQFRSEIAGLSVQPAKTKGGAVKLLLVIDPLSPGTILRGVITIRTASLTRTIHLNANAPAHSTGTETVGSGQEVYVPEDWQTLYAGDEETDVPAQAPAPLPQPAATSARQAPAVQPPKASVSIPPPPPKSGKQPRPARQSGPEVTVPDRLEPAARSIPASAPKPNVFDSDRPTVTKPAPDDDETADSPSSRARSKRRRPPMGSSLFDSTPASVEQADTADAASTASGASGAGSTAAAPPARSPQTPGSSVVPPPPPRKSGSTPASKQPSSSVVPPPPPKKPSPDNGPSPPAAQQPSSSVVPPPPKRPKAENDASPAVPQQPSSSVVPPPPKRSPPASQKPSSSVVPPPPKKPTSNKSSPDSAPAPQASKPVPADDGSHQEDSKDADSSKKSQRQNKSGLGGAFG